jgi:membrane associated rhomboid family serine protease
MSNYISPGGYNVLPPVVKNLLIINGLMFLAKMIVPGVFRVDLDAILGLHYWGASMFYPFQFITYMFMHGDLGHLIFNMFALWMFGATLENYWGAKRFLFFYFFTGIGAAIVHYTVFYFQISPTLEMINAYLEAPDFTWFKSFVNSTDFIASPSIINQYNAVFVPAANGAASDAGVLQASIDFMTYYREAYLNMHTVVGASGAIYGLLLAFGMLFPNALIYLYFLFPIKAKWFVIAFGAIELFSGIRGGGNVAHFAHLGGMLFGIILILYWRRKDIDKFYHDF